MSTSSRGSWTRVTATNASRAAPRPPVRRLQYLALAVAGTLWGSSFLLAKIALEELLVGQMILYRFAFACVVLVPIAIRRSEPIRRADIPLWLIAAVVGVPVQFLVEFEGLARTTVSHASLMIGMLPMLLAGAAMLFAGERLDRTGWLLLAGSTLGAALVVLDGTAAAAPGGPTLAGDALVLASLLAVVGWILLTKRLLAHASPIAVSTYVLIAGTAMLAVWEIALDGVPPVGLSTRTWLALAGLGVFATAVTTLLWNWALASVPASAAGIFVNLEPVVGTVLGVLVLHDRFGAATVVGGLVIVGAAVALSVRDAT